MPAPALQSPLTLYVVWHPDFTGGAHYADFIYRTFNRDTFHPFDRSLGIPVFFRTEPGGSGCPRAIDLSEADRNVVIVLVDNCLVADEGEWDNYISNILRDCRGRGPLNHFLPVALTEHAFNLTEDVRGMNSIRLYNIEDEEEVESPAVDSALGTTLPKAFKSRTAFLRSGLLVELTRLMLPTAVKKAVEGTAATPVKFFLSHARADGAEAAESVRAYIRANTSLDSFLDVTDIGFGYEFAKTIQAHIDSSALIIFQSDKYASRDWCQIEALAAKKNKSPIVVVNAVERGERRSFPYLGNVPTIRWADGIQAEVVDLALEQVLNNLFTQQSIEKFCAYHERPQQYVLAQPPELLDFAEIRQSMRKEGKEDCVVIYPDPPLGNAESLLLSDNDARIVFLTPSSLPILFALSRA
jgi:hypothetical protein